MAIINKNGITNGGTIEAEHITRIIDALSSGSSEIAATGSLTGSLLGTASFATTASFALNASGTGFPFTGSARITGSLIVTGSITNRNGNLNVTGQDHVISGSSTVQLTAGNIQLSGNSLTATTLDINANLGDTSIITGTPASQIDFSENGNTGVGFFRIPLVRSDSPEASGHIYWDDATSKLFIYSQTAAAWLTASFG